ncbi:MAG: cobalt-precorrin-6A reductase [Propionibacteriaceae bacterium]|nr:cobalt-precorrin-6A reductase [Propionibacteriaceae bacterium]
MKTLILGGVREGRELAELLVTAGIPVITSLAGRVNKPARVAGEVRVGGFGGADGLATWLRAENIGQVVDATHPFAERISANAVAACRQAGVPLLRIDRPSWESHPLAATWQWAPSHSAAARLAAAHERVLLTVGRQSVAPYLELNNIIARMVEAPDVEVPGSWTLLLDRGPYTLDSERELLTTEHISALVTKDSGGALTEPKLQAAAELGVAVIVVRRAPLPADIPRVTTAAEAAAWLAEHRR